MKEQNMYVTTDFETWKSSLLQSEIKNPALIATDKLIFPDDIKQVAAGYMLAPVGCANGCLLTSMTHSGNSIQECVEYLKSLSSDFDVYVHQILWRHVQVDGYTLNSIMVRFATTGKTHE